MTLYLKIVIMERSRLKNKANKALNPVIKQLIKTKKSSHQIR